MAGDDDRTAYAGMSQIYAHIYDSRKCDMLREQLTTVVSMSYDRRTYENRRTIVCE